MATMEVSRDLPLRLEFKPDSSYRRGGKHRGMHSILMPTIRETEVAFTVPAHLLGPDQAQVSQQSKNSHWLGSLSAGRAA